MKICHLTSVHHRNDTRIFIKEIPTLVHAGYDVMAVVADGKGFEKRKGFEIYDTGAENSRFKRIFISARNVYRKAIEIDADVYHFHDPELIPAGKKLIRKGKKVIYDVHEDVPRDIISKDWIPKLFRSTLARLFELYENSAAKRFSSIITATPLICSRFQKYNKSTYNINNYPIINELKTPGDEIKKDRIIAYIGEITRIRGAIEMVKAMEFVNGKLYLAGPFESESLKSELQKLKGWEKVKDFGFVNRLQAKDILNQSIAGLVIFHPEPNHINAQPNKIFEYMSAGIPVIGSDFHLWKEIIEGNHAGMCVNPLNPEAIAQAINFLLENREEAKKMGLNGVKAILEKFNWEFEAEKIINIYKNI
jgi:glycosyltransferase involved in cell wall biosynthesis